MKFPKVIYVKIDGDKGEEYLLALNNIRDHAGIGERVKVAVYSLVEINEVSCVVKAEKVRSA